MLLLLLACAHPPPGDKADTSLPVDSADSGPPLDSTDSDPPADTVDTHAPVDTADTSAPPCDQPLQVAVSGLPLPSAATLDLGQTPALASPLRATLTLTNPCPADKLRFLGHPDDWVSGEGYTMDALPPVYLDPGQRADIGLTFTPGLAGLSTGALSLPYDQVGSPYQLSLSATVTDPLPIAFFGEGRRVSLTLDYGDSWAADSYETLTAHTNALQRGACGGPLGFVSVGGNDRRNLWLSPDGLSWTTHDDGGGWIADCAYGDGLYLAVGSGGALLASADLSTFTPGGSGSGSSLLAVAYGDGVFVAVGHDRRASTTDGLTLSTDQTSPHGEVNHIAYGDGVFVAVGADGLIETTTDAGATWTAQTLGSGDWGGVVYLLDRFLIGNGAELYDSTDGLHWALVNASTVTPLTAVGAMAFGTMSGSLHRSDDGGFSWTEILPASDAPAFLDAAPGAAP